MRAPVSALIVDDESHIRLYVKLILQQLGLTQFFEAKSGEEAIEVFEQHRPDVVLLDINMTGMTGIEALPEIMKIDPEAVVIMLTGQASRHLVDRSGQGGATYFIRKDTDKEAIKKTLAELFADIWGEE